jgi:hypothetical protein
VEDLLRNILKTLQKYIKTLKRKKQLREFVEHYNDGYDDDLYDSTPYRKQGTVKVSTCFYHLDNNQQSDIKVYSSHGTLNKVS